MNKAYKKGLYGSKGYKHFDFTDRPSDVRKYNQGVNDRYAWYNKEQLKKKKLSQINKLIRLQELPEKEKNLERMGEVDEDVYENAVARVTDPHPRGYARVDRHRGEILKRKHYRDGEPKREAINRRRDVEMDFTFKYRVLVAFCTIFLTDFIYRIIYSLGFTITGLISIVISLVSATISEIYMHHKKLSCDGKGHCMLFLKNFFECFIMISVVVFLLHLL